MPDDVKTLDAPRAENYDNSFANSLADQLQADRQAGQAHIQDLTDLADQKLDSFVSGGDAFTLREAIETDSQGTVTYSRQDMIGRVRDNILKRLEKENTDSRDEADALRRDHEKLTSTLVGEFTEYSRKTRDSQLITARISALRGANYQGEQAGRELEISAQLNTMLRNLDADLTLKNDPMMRSVVEQNVPELRNPALLGQPAAGAVPAAGAMPGAAGNPAGAVPVPPVPPVPAMPAGAFSAFRAQNANEVTQDTILERVNDILEVKKALDQVRNAAPQANPGWFQRRRAQKGEDALKDDQARAARERTALYSRMLKQAGDWAANRTRYANDRVTKHYVTYDSLAMSWYQLTREYSTADLDPTMDPIDLNIARSRRRIEREIKGNAAKNIIEYTGVYNLDAIRALAGRVRNNPYLEVNAQDIPVEDYKQNRNPSNPGVIDPGRHTKAHRKIVMLSQPDAQGIRTRWKFNSSFSGRRAKRQYNPNAREILVSVDPNSVDAHYFDPHNAEDDEVKLEADRRDRFGRFVISERNAEILSATRKARKGTTKNLSRRDVHGFYINDEFFTDEDDLGAERASGKEDMSFFGRRSWKLQDSAEELRRAIRNSAFFQHVNARTIQYYAGYQVDEDYGQKIQAGLSAGWSARANAGNSDRAGTVQALLALNPANASDAQVQPVLNGISEEMCADALAGYIVARVNNPGNQPFSLMNDQVYIRVRQKHQGIQVRTAVILLIQTMRPDLWTIARDMVEHSGTMTLRGQKILAGLPRNGELMRTELLDELVNHQAWNSEFDWRDPNFDVTSFIQPISQINVWQKESMSQRGKLAWLKRNFWNGSLVKKATGIASTVITSVNLGEDAPEYQKDHDYKPDAETREYRLQEALWSKYASAMSQSTRATMILATAIGGISGLVAGLATDKKDKAGFGAQVGRNFAIESIDLLAIFNSLEKIVIMMKRLHEYNRDKNDPQKIAERNAQLQSLDEGGAIKEVMNFISTAMDLIDACRDIISFHITTRSGDPLSSYHEKTSDWFKGGGYLGAILDGIQNICMIVNEIVDAHNARKRMNRIDEADISIEQAIRAYDALRGPQNVASGNYPLPAPAAPAGGANPAGGAVPAGGANPAGGAVPAGGANPAPDANLGYAALRNSQVQQFMSLTRGNDVETRTRAGFRISAGVLNVVKDGLTFQPEPISRIVFTVAPKVVEFAGWITKLGQDRHYFNKNLSSMLGNDSYSNTYYFDETLKKETGIVNKHYLVDLARIFSSIDTHVLLTKPNKTPGEDALSQTMLKTLYTNVNPNTMRTAKLSELLAYSGLDKGTNWRALLRFSLTS